jgi:hypothetical protein
MLQPFVDAVTAYAVAAAANVGAAVSHLIASAAAVFVGAATAYVCAAAACVGAEGS